MSLLRVLVRPVGPLARWSSPVLIRCTSLKASVPVPEFEPVAYQKPALRPVAEFYTKKMPAGLFQGNLSNIMKEKLGHTGLLSLTAGVSLFLVSKELYVLNIESTILFSMCLSYGFMVYKAAPFLDRYITKCRNNYVGHLYKAKRDVLDTLDSGVKAMDNVEEQASVRRDVFDVVRANVALQREAMYRSRVARVNEELVKRLEHQAELEASRRRNVQEHMVRWVELQVQKGFTPDLEKKIVDRCIANLKSMSAA